MGFAGSSGLGFLLLVKAVGSSEDSNVGGITPKLTLVLGRSVPHKLFDRGNQFHAGFWPSAVPCSMVPSMGQLATRQPASSRTSK